MWVPRRARPPYILTQLFAFLLLAVFAHSVTSYSLTPWNAAHQASLSTTNSWSLLKLMSIESVMPSNHLILYCPLLLPSFNLSQHQGFFQWVDSSHQGGQSIGASASASVLLMNIQGWFPLGLTGFISIKSKGLSRVFSSTIVWKRQFFGAQPFLWSNSHISTWLLENHSFHYMDLCQQSDVSAF